MSNKWEVEFTCVVTIAVEDCESEEQAIDFAKDEISMSLSNGLVEARAEQVDESKWEMVCRHAHAISRSDQ